MLCRLRCSCPAGLLRRSRTLRVDRWLGRRCWLWSCCGFALRLRFGAKLCLRVRPTFGIDLGVMFGFGLRASSGSFLRLAPRFGLAARFGFRVFFGGVICSSFGGSFRLSFGFRFRAPIGLGLALGQLGSSAFFGLRLGLSFCGFGLAFFCLGLLLCSFGLAPCGFGFLLCGK